jgi:flavin reductase (DIM6/NTAB) family NADH-FMN oxidoreductase RutF
MTPHPSPSTFDPTSSADYRALLGRVPTSVVVIASMDEEGPVGLSVGSFTSVSIEPPLVGFFIARSSTTWPRIAATGRFCASVLSRSQDEVSRLFATRGADKFGGCRWEQNAAGLPLITSCTAWFDCAIDTIVDSGDHVLVLGRIGAMGSGVGGPLVFLGGRYGGVELDESMH